MLKDFTILEENDLFYAIQKPEGLIVNRAHSVKSKSLQDYIQETYTVSVSKEEFKLLSEIPNESNLSYSDISDEFVSRDGIVHRLDKDTSGVLLVAKNVIGYMHLKNNFLKRSMHKSYVALVWRDIHSLLADNKYININLPLGRDPTDNQRRAVIPAGKEALTNVEPFSAGISKNNDGVFPVGDHTFSLVKAKPITGRTHQIRIHLKALNHEVFGDPIYCGRRQLRTSDKYSTRLMLHSINLSFKIGDTDYSIDSPLPDSFTKVLKELV